MATRISEALGVNRKQLERYGAFDGFVDIDARFHVDPHLLDASAIPELDGSHDRLLKRFESIFFLVSKSTPGDAMDRAALRLLLFPERDSISLGYGAKGGTGSGIGLKLAKGLLQTARQIISIGITEPEIFELVGLFEPGIGADRISDMAIDVLQGDFAAYSARVAKELGVATVSYEVGDSIYLVPSVNDDPIILVPKDILQHLPVAEDWSEIDTVCAHNDMLRMRVNKRIGDNWRHATKRITKSELRRTLFDHPELFKDLLEQYRGKPARQYDFRKDPAGELIWHDIATRFAADHPLQLALGKRPSQKEVHGIVLEVCERYADLIQSNGLWALLYDDQGNLRNERFAQLLFFGIADSYCEANDIGLSREPNAGVGPVDFKFSSGYEIRMNVEVKYSSNTALVRGFTTQLPAYNAAEKARSSVYLVIRIAESEASIKRLKKTRDEAVNQGMRVPDLVVTDGRKRKSASKRR